jgi:hypothetical protein
MQERRAYIDLKDLATYSSCSIRWLRDRLTDSNHPLPHYRIGGKILIKPEEFDIWISRFRIAPEPGELDRHVESIVAELSA